MSIDESTICPAVWDHLCVNTRGNNRLCCNATTQQFDTFLGNYDNHWNELRDGVKKEMLQGKKPEICKVCWDREDSGISSLRQSFVSRYKNTERWNKFVETIDTTRPSPVELDLKLGNYCNLSCRMCNSFSSSMYATELHKIHKETGINLSKNEQELIYKQTKWFTDPIFIERIKQYIDDGLLEIKFTGGEPLMVPGVKEIIEHCITTGAAKNIQIQLITNITLLTEEWLEKLSYFELVVLTCSIDGTGDTYEYIRHPTNWRDVYSKLKQSKKYTNSNFILELTFTLQTYNMLEIKHMIDLRRELECRIGCITLYEPDYLDVRNATQQLKDDALLAINNIKSVTKHERIFLNNTINKINQEPNADLIAMKYKLKMISETKDPFRNQDFSKQRIYKYYE